MRPLRFEVSVWGARNDFRHPVLMAREAAVVDLLTDGRLGLGRRVLSLIERYTGWVRFLVPEEAVADARAYVPQILIRKGLPEGASMRFLETLERLPLLVTVMPCEAYADLETEARLRLKGRDEEDWPILALGLKLGCPVWTEDQDFFGSRVATWTSDRVELYLRG